MHSNWGFYRWKWSYKYLQLSTWDFNYFIRLKKESCQSLINIFCMKLENALLITRFLFRMLTVYNIPFMRVTDDQVFAVRLFGLLGTLRTTNSKISKNWRTARTVYSWNSPNTKQVKQLNLSKQPKHRTAHFERAVRTLKNLKNFD